MKKIGKYIFMPLVFLLSGCFDEQEFFIPDGLKYVAFESSSIVILEGETTSVDARIIYSGPALTSSLSIPVSVVDGEGNTAVDGVDYSIETGVSAVAIPTGEYEQTISISIINNDEAVGARTFSLNIGSISGFNIGAPDNADAGSVQITILEDDLNLFGYTSFEEPAAGDVNNYPAINGIDQPNVPGENSVDYTSVGNEMGFDTSYVPGQEGGADSGLLYGVSKFTSDADWGYDVGAFPDGDQAYSTSDSDGLMEIVFDELTIPDGASILQVSLSLWFANASFESDDEFDFFWRTDDGDELILSLRSDGADMTDSADGSGNNIEEQWTNFLVEVDNKKTGRLVIQIGTDSGAEINFIDNILIEGL
ncbi:Calx-beta domain-containing protein [Fulvivirgaceae bacterium BMA10]|uniref:Calx-beta domain-containing protein n=1 Tax=Splendidivirga corallicola TaxID=3051826 RepID=A0ABT8KVW8_9BACT|nr:Calx-beta domain-containing protein [Fulvivirgaceae bacterium BMA10]